MTDTPSSSAPRLVRLGTRGSPLALPQAHQIAAGLKSASGGALEAAITAFTTTGDKLTSERLINSGGKGLFTRELDESLSLGDIDIAVHSLKDVPSLLPPGQVFVASPSLALTEAASEPSIQDAWVETRTPCRFSLPTRLVGPVSEFRAVLYRTAA